MKTKSTTGAADCRPTHFPQPLCTGDLIAIVAPASTPDPDSITRSLEYLRDRGYRIRIGGDPFAKRGYLAGDDRARADSLMSAFTDPDVRAILCARGGYGTGRILEFLDFDTISRNAKIVAGYSDITVLHAAIASQCNFVTYHSPHPQDGWGCVDQLCQQTCDSFWSQLESPSIFDDRDGNAPRPLELVSGTALVEGTAEGRLLGGNLAVFVTLLGTRFMPDMRGAILFLEDIGERPYRVDRYLSQLRLSGVLKQLAGVILGHFADCTGDPHDDSLTLDEVFADYFGDLGIPVWQGYPSGHARPNLTLPLGATIRLDTNNTDQYTDGD